MGALTDRKDYILASLLLGLTVVIIGGCGPSARDERAVLHRRVNTMLDYLRNGQISRGSIKDYFAHRPRIARIKENKGLLIHRLKEVKDQEPEFSDDYTKAVYESAEFVKKEGTWYLESVDR